MMMASKPLLRWTVMVKRGWLSMTETNSKSNNGSLRFRKVVRLCSSTTKTNPEPVHWSSNLDLRREALERYRCGPDLKSEHGVGEDIFCSCCGKTVGEEIKWG
ncbi:hypothetical protein CsatA_010568 [Cannabis sativa]